MTFCLTGGTPEDLSRISQITYKIGAVLTQYFVRKSICSRLGVNLILFTVYGASAGTSGTRGTLGTSGSGTSGTSGTLGTSVDA